MKPKFYLIDTKNRITIPSKVLDQLNAESGDYIYYEYDNNKVFLHKLKIS